MTTTNGLLPKPSMSETPLFYLGLAKMAQNPPDSTDKGLYSHGHYSSSHGAGYGHHSAGHHNAGFPPFAYLFSSHSPHYGGFWGKSAWPELVGVKGNVAAERIKMENPKIKHISFYSPVIWIQDTRSGSDVVRLWLDREGIVVKMPAVG